MADVTGKPVKVPVVKEATALGAAILAGVGVGLYANVEEAVERTVKWDCVYQPDASVKAVYDGLYANWKQIYPTQLALCDQGLTRNMWIAPGL